MKQVQYTLGYPAVVYLEPQLSGIESDCCIRVFRVKVCVLLEYFNEALYINVWASIIQIIYLSEHFYNFLRTKGVRITKGLLYTKIYHDFKCFDVT